MADLSSNLDALSAQQASHFEIANALFSAASPATLFSRQNSTSNLLSFGLHGGIVTLDGARTRIANLVIADCPASITSDGLYLEAGRISSTTKNITSISKASEAQITASSHGYAVGNLVYVNAAVVGMTQIRQTFGRVVSVVDSNNFTVDVPSTNFTTYTSGGTVALAAIDGSTVVAGKSYAWHAGLLSLYRLTTDATSITNYKDYRIAQDTEIGVSALVMGSDANAILTGDQARGAAINITSSVSLTATRNIILSFLSPRLLFVYNGTTGSQSLTFIGPSGTGITVANGKRAILATDGTNVVRWTADQ